MTSKKSGTTIHRDAGTGRIVPAHEVIRRPATTVTEHYPSRPSGPAVTIHRDTRSGRIVPEVEVQRRPSTTVTEHYKRKP